LRILKPGKVRDKSSAYKEAARLAEDSLPMKKYSKGEKVQVYSGHGWQTGSVIHSDENRCSVFLTTEQRFVCCSDNRNLMKP